MNPLTKAAALAALLAAALAACSGGGKNVPASSAGAIAAVAPQRGSSDVAYGADLLTDAQYLGPATLDSLGVDVFVTMRDAAGLVNYAAQVSDPLSPLYRQWLRPEELGDRFGAIKDDYDATAAALRSFGIATKTYPQRQMIRARGPQPALERALGTTFAYYRKGDVVFVAPATAPHPSAAVHIAALGALAGYSANQRAFVPVRAGNALVQGLTPRQIANVFDFTGAWNAGYTGRGINVGIIATGPITDGDPRIAIGDVADFKVLYGLGGSGAIRQVFGTDANVSPGNGSPGGSYSTGLATPPPVTNINCKGTLPACNPEDIEAQLDTEQASTLAPDANVLFYIAYNPNECNSRTPCGTGGAPAAAPAIGINETDDEIQQAIGDNQADVISMSFGIGEPQGKGFNFNANGVGFGPTEFASLVAEGIAVFASSGDT
ncbi:MAG: hypothetical protein GIW95_00065, partial [Candidatus Eremiobacteraeota bacterium]|nr:hypothetical protein [Candidatus Eremiobacteraeota bacterium]